MELRARKPAADTAGSQRPRTSPPPHRALLALAALGREYGRMIDPVNLAHDLVLEGRLASLDDLLRAGKLSGISLTLLQGQLERDLLRQRKPALLHRNDDSWVVVLPSPAGETLPVIDPGQERIRPERIKVGDLAARWTGELLVATDLDPDARGSAAFGFAWFLPTLWRYRSSIAHVLLASCFVQAFALVTPLLFQIVIDKVLVHKAMATLSMVTFALLTLGAFEVVLQYLRTYVLAHTANRLDVELGARLFRHLLSLPLWYFESRPAGQTVARVRELETVRNFLTGQGLAAGIDMLFVTIFLVVLLLYSVKLALVVILAIPLYVLVAFVLRPLLRMKVQERYNRGAASQQFLVESIVGAYTLKAAAAEPLIERQWSERLAAYVRTSFEALMIANIGQNAIQYLTKVTTAAILFVGAQEVIDAKMTVGALIAFNMISAQVTNPILRLSQLWQDFQQIQVSVQRLGDIFMAVPETQTETVPPPGRLRGAVTLRDIQFRYTPTTAPVIKGLSLNIPAGQVIGIVGPSGSGKSTLAKLIQRLCVPEQGTIEIDGIDAAKLPLRWLRRQIGVVLQENLLFNKTVRENIALSVPYLDLSRIISLARLAGAHEFITRLPQGYDSPIVERGANLSGGQRQRLAIARALARNPRILILDEATSALDYESERVIQSNMRQIARNRTVIVIAHRLAAVRQCDRIVCIVDGEIVEDGTHDELVQKAGGHYARLWDIQSGMSA